MMPADLDAHVRAMVAWHFDPATGSPYWLRRQDSLGFDPVAVINGFDDLLQFPAIAPEWRSVSAADLIPRGCAGPFSVWETGGTTGPPTRIVDAAERLGGLERINQLLDGHGFPGTPPGPCVTGWLHLGPTGPHLVGRNSARLAHMRGTLPFTVDLDPRWVKRLYQMARGDEARRYTDHVINQALILLRSQPIDVLTTTPPLLQALCDHPEAYELLQQKVRGIIWFGTSLSPESLRFYEEELLPGVCFVGWYGNTLMGISCQRPRRGDDSFGCIFSPPSPSGLAAVVDPSDARRPVPYGARGQVRISVLNRELFLPWHLERDSAIRVEPNAGDPWDGLASVAPLEGADPQIEGVY